MIALAAPATAQVVSITQAKAQAGGITPGDTPGYPVTISASGSYRLDSNLTVATSAGNGIAITAPNVTIDFNGFVLDGVTSAGNAITATVDGVTLRNGTIKRFKDVAVDIGSYWLVEKMAILSSGGILSTDDTGLQVVDSTMSSELKRDSPGLGFSNSSGLVRNNIITKNIYGVSGLNGPLIGNMITDNTFEGVFGDSAKPTGYAQNFLASNGMSSFGSQVQYVRQMHPNHCVTGTCP